MTITNRSSAILPTFTTEFLPVIQEGFYMGHDANQMGVNSSSFTSWDGHNYSTQIFPTNANDTTPGFRWLGGTTNTLMSILDRTNSFSMYPGNGKLAIFNDSESYLQLDNIAGTLGSYVQGDQASGGDMILRPFRDLRIAPNHFLTESARFYAGGGVAIGNLLGNPGTNQVRISGSTTFYDNAGTAMAQLLAAGDEVLTLNTNEHLKINAHDGTTLMVFYDAAGTAIEMRPTNGTVYIEHPTTPKLVLSDIAGNNAFQIFGDPVGGVGTVRAATNMFLEVNGGPTAVSLYHTGGEYFGPVPSDPGAFTYKFAGSIIATTNVDAATYSIGGAALISTGGGNVNMTGHLVEGIVDITTLTAGHGIITNGFQVNTNSLYVTNNAVGIGTIAPTHVLHIVTATNDAVGIDSTGTDSNSMLHIKNTSAQGPFFDFWAANDRYGYGVASGGAFDIRHTTTGNDPVNGTNILTLDASSVLTVATVDATTAVSTPTVNSGTINNTNAITTGSLSATTNVTAGAIVGTNSVTSGGFVLKQVSLTQGVSPLADSTNQVLDFSQGMYQIWALTNDVCFTNFTGSASAATIKFRPNGANRNVLIDTNWMPVNVQGGTLNGSHYQFVVTNGTTFSVLSAWASGANATNVAAVWANF